MDQGLLLHICTILGINITLFESSFRFWSVTVPELNRSFHEVVTIKNLEKRGGSEASRRWSIVKKSADWFFCVCIQREIHPICPMITNFRILYLVYYQLVLALGHYLLRLNIKMRSSFKPEIRIAAFLMFAGGITYSQTANQFGIDVRTVGKCVNEVSELIRIHFSNVIHFPV